MTPPNSRHRHSARSAGILLHPTSLPGRFGVGDLGPAAHAWIDALARAQQGWWQVLPLAPTGYGDSPYACLSAFAGNPTLVSPDLLLRDGLLRHGDLGEPDFAADRIDFGRVIPYKSRLLHTAWEHFRSGEAPALRWEFEGFCARHSAWLEDYVLFSALKDAHGGGSWLDWEQNFVFRDPHTLSSARERLADAIDEHRFRQFLFFRQWAELRQHAQARGVRILGDAPIFVAVDSADVWSHPEFFKLDEQRRPRVVAGVPPDYFSETGQLWGNPLYDWEVLWRDGYQWWIDRLRAMLDLVDLVRIDHFRGFEGYWEIEAGMPTAEKGHWVPGPNAALFDKLRAALGSLPILAEDLGVITPEVDALRERLDLPGMCVLQFAFHGDPNERFLPHRHERNSAVYTGTHDNDTSRGWHAKLSEKERKFFDSYLGRESGDTAWDLMRLAWGSVANTAIAPFQDALDLGSEARMNYPSRASGNWTWRFTEEQCTDAVLDRLGELTETYGRAPDTATTPAE